MSQILNLKVAASHDDAYEREYGHSMDLEYETLLFLSGPTVYARWWPAMRFIPEEPIPKDATILSAYLRVKVTDEEPADANINLHFEMSAAPNAFQEDDYNITNRPRTTASTPWVQDGAGSGWLNSPSLVEALQELVDAYEVSDLVVISRPNQDDYKEFYVDSYDMTPENAPELYIEYETVEVVEPTVQTNAATNVKSTSAKLHGLLVDDGGEACTVRFEYGIKPALDKQTDWQ